MYGGRLPIPAVKVEDMSTTNREDGKNNYCGPSFGAVLFGLREYGPKMACLRHLRPCCSSDERNVDNCKCLWG